MKLTIGGFDGMHLGHMALINRSDAYLVIEKNSNLTIGLDRIEYSPILLDILCLEKIKHLSADEFIEVLKNYGVKEIVVGYDFKFGKNRSGDINTLKKAFKVEVIDEIKYQNIGIHSRIIREFILNKDIKTATNLLGHPYKIKGLQIKGQGIGSKKLLPTINIETFKNYLLPQGVFITKTNGYDSITFIGVRSTDNNFSIETHILSSEFQVPSSKSKILSFEFQVLSAKLIEIEFLDFIRDNRKFNSLDELKTAIYTDKQKAVKYFEQYQKQYH